MKNCKSANKPHFLTGIILLIVSIYIILESIFIILDTNVKLYTSPGLLPLILGILLLLCTMILLKRSIGTNFKSSFSEMLPWIKHICYKEDTKRTFVGIIMLGIYVFIFIPFLKFKLGSLAFLLMIMFVLKATKPLYIVIIAIMSVACTYLLFQIVFHVPLP